MTDQPKCLNCGLPITWHVEGDCEVLDTRRAGADLALVAAVRAEERSRVTVEQIAETLHNERCDCIKYWEEVQGEKRQPGHPTESQRAAAAAVHRLITGETP